MLWDGIKYMDKKVQFEIDETAERHELEKYANFSFLYDIWMKNMENGKSISAFFSKRKYKTIAIYGMGMIGKHLLRQLKDTDIQVLFTIDGNIVRYGNQQICYEEIGTITEVPDAIVITPLLEFEKIGEKLRGVFDTAIVSVEEVILSI
jgi:hypothetical protein